MTESDRFGTGNTLMATFTDEAEATAAVDELLDQGFLNVGQEQDGHSWLVLVDAGGRAELARTILAQHGGT